MMRVSGRVDASGLIALILTWRGQFLHRQNPAHRNSCQGMHAVVEGEADVGELLALQASRHAAGNHSACQWRY